jgi:HEAT repeat protein
MFPMRARVICTLAVFLSPCHLVTLSPCHASQGGEIDSPMYQSPDLPRAPVKIIYSPKARALWLDALARPEAEMRCKAAATIVLARKRGVPGLEEAVRPLIEALDKPEPHAAARLAIAQALIALDARASAASLLRQAKTGSSDLCDVVEPALAKWDHRPARELWLARLRSSDTPHHSLELAIRCLGEVREEKAAEELRSRALAERALRTTRLEAARALGLILDKGLEKDAERLAADRSTGGRLAAALLLHRHNNKAAINLLQRLLLDREGSVAALAAGRLIEIDVKLANPGLDSLLGSFDAKLRSLGVEVLFRQPSEKNVRLLAARLEDVHPDVRDKARRSLQELAVKKGLRKEVIEQGMKRVDGKWMAVEQSSILLADLDHKAAADKLVQRLEAARPEVFITAAWALRRLAVRDSLPGVLKYVEEEAKRVRAMKRLPGREKVQPVMIDHQLSQLGQLLGRMCVPRASVEEEAQRVQPMKRLAARADAVLRRCVPRTSVELPESRAAAIWALGLIHEGKKDAVVAKLVTERLTDTNSMPPEDPRVRRMAAITLGRLKATESLKTLRIFAPALETAYDPVGSACRWAIHEITGEALPPLRTVEKRILNWFLIPND